MIESLSKKYQLNRKEAEVSLLSYLKSLGQKRFIGFLIPGEEGVPHGRASGSSGEKWKK